MAHLSLIDRETIEESLNENKNFTEIGKQINKHRTSVSDEISKHRIKQLPNTYGRNRVFCKYESTCNNFRGVACTKKCIKFETKECPRLSKPPYVCNGYKKKNGCTFVKYYYRATEANKNYLNLLSEAREGIRLSQEEIDNIDKCKCTKY